jgi:GDP-mannose transporter
MFQVFGLYRGNPNMQVHGAYHVPRFQHRRGQKMYDFDCSKSADIATNEFFLGFPITLLLIGMIYTGSKALQFLSIPVYTIFKNLTIILIAYGEVLWFGGSVTNLTLFSFGLMVFSSLIAAWADIKHAVESTGDTSSKVSTLNAGYVWMLINCLCTSSYVLGMRKRIKLTNFKDFDSMWFFQTCFKPILTYA